MSRLIIAVNRIPLVLLLVFLSGGLSPYAASGAEVPKSKPKLNLLLIGPLKSGESCVGNLNGFHERIKNRLRKLQYNEKFILRHTRLIPDEKFIDAVRGKDYSLNEFEKNNFQLAREIGRKTGADFVYLLDRKMAGSFFTKGCQFTRRLIEVNDPKGIYIEVSKYMTSMTRREKKELSQNARKNLFGSKARTAILEARSRKAVASRATSQSVSAPAGRPTLLVLGMLEGFTSYSNSASEILRSFLNDAVPDLKNRFQIISGKAALDPLRQLPEAEGIDFSSYDTYSILQKNNYRLARKFGKAHGADFVAILARDNVPKVQGGSFYLSLIDVEDPRRSLSGSEGRGNYRETLKSLLSDLLFRSKEGIEQARARRRALGPRVQQARLPAPGTEKKATPPSRKRGAQGGLDQSATFELAFWDAIKNSKNAEDYRAYLEQYPKGQFAALAKIRLKQHTKVAKRPAQSFSPPSFSSKKSEKPNLYGRLGRYHALVIGNNNYRSISKLKTAVNDARAVADVLKREYGFNVKLLLNATRYQILAALSRLRRKLTERDNLLVYYAGHGFLDKAAETGYWLPVDADKDITANWIGTHDLTSSLKAMNAKHVMIVADSCYSGTLIRSGPTQLRSGMERMAWLKRMQIKRSRTVLTSGGLEPVVDSGGGDHSVFAKAFLEALRENDWVLEGQDLFSKIQRPVVVNSKQTPEYSDIRETGHEGGDFIFVRKP